MRADWFKTKFELIAKESSENWIKGLASIDEAATTQKEESMKKVEFSLENFGHSTTKGALDEMDKYKGDYMQEISETQELLMDSEWVMEEDMHVMIDEIDENVLDILEDILSE